MRRSRRSRAGCWLRRTRSDYGDKSVGGAWSIYRRPGLHVFSERIGSRLVYFVPRDNIVQRAEINKKTVIEYDPESNQADEYLQLAKNVIENDNFVIPRPLEYEELEQLMMESGVLA
jgi:nitrogenase subunit NifH